MGGRDTVTSAGVSLGSRGCWGGQGGEERGEEGGEERGCLACRRRRGERKRRDGEKECWGMEQSRSVRRETMARNPHGRSELRDISQAAGTTGKVGCSGSRAKELAL